MLRLLRAVARALAPMTLGAAVLAYFEPGLFLIFKSSFLWLFAATMFAIGVVLEPRDLDETVRRPQRIVLGVLTQYTVMPVLGFGAATATVAAGLPKEVALGFVIVGCAPGAMASNVIVYLAGGAVAFSVALTTVATVLAPVVTPGLVELLGNAFLDIPFWPMMQTITLTVLLPLLGGMWLQRHLGARLALAREVAPAVAAVAIVVICAYAVAANQARIASVAPPVFAAVVLLNGAGYLLGWYLGRLYRFDHRHRVTLMIEIGMQNAGLGVALALRHFAPETALPGALFAVWCIVTAAGAGAWLRRGSARPAVAELP